MKLGNNEKKKRKKIRQRRVKKKETKGLMYKTKGVEPIPRVEMNKIQAKEFA